MVADKRAWSPLRFSLAACTFVPRLPPEEGPERTDSQEAPSRTEESQNGLSPLHDPFAGVLALPQVHPEWKSTQLLQESRCLPPARADSATVEALPHDHDPLHPPGRSPWEDPWPPERIQGGHGEPPLTELPLPVPEAVVSAADSLSTPFPPLPTPAPETPSSAGAGAGHPAQITIEQAIAAYLEELRAIGRDPKTLQWHHTELCVLRRSLWRQFHLTDVGALTEACLQIWVTDLPLVLSVRTGVPRTISTVSAYARSAGAFCNWQVRQGSVSEPLFPTEVVLHVQRGVPQPVEPEAFVHLVRACQLPGAPGGPHANMMARNRAILWLPVRTRDYPPPRCAAYAWRMWTAPAEP